MPNPPNQGTNWDQEFLDETPREEGHVVKYKKDQRRRKEPKRYYFPFWILCAVRWFFRIREEVLGRKCAWSPLDDHIKNLWQLPRRAEWNQRFIDHWRTIRTAIRQHRPENGENNAWNQHPQNIPDATISYAPDIPRRLDLEFSAEWLNRGRTFGEFLHLKFGNMQFFGGSTEEGHCSECAVPLRVWRGC